MITQRIAQIKALLQVKSPKTESDIEALKLIEELDRMEDTLHNNYISSGNTQFLLEMYIRPQGDSCERCGRTLK